MANKIDLLRKVPLLERLDATRLRLLADKMLLEAAAENEIIVKEHDDADKLYILVSGNVTVTKAKEYGFQVLAKLGAGDFFGEIAILRNIPRTATVTASSSCSLLSIDKKTFLHFYEEFPPHIRDDMQLIIAKRLAEMHA